MRRVPADATTPTASGAWSRPGDPCAGVRPRGPGGGTPRTATRPEVAGGRSGGALRPGVGPRTTRSRGGEGERPSGRPCAPPAGLRGPPPGDPTASARLAAPTPQREPTAGREFIPPGGSRAQIAVPTRFAPPEGQRPARGRLCLRRIPIGRPDTPPAAQPLPPGPSWRGSGPAQTPRSTPGGPKSRCALHTQIQPPDQGGTT